MKKVVIGVGNKLMLDDGIAIFVLENIKSVLEDNGIEVIIGETDVDFCFSKLNNVDEFYIADSYFSDRIPGDLTFKKIKDVKKIREHCAVHSLGLMDLINIYKIEIKGYFIGIEIGSIDMSIGLSNDLEVKFKDICSKILSFILNMA
ncbi:hydrogenase maturation protease [Clostridium scatologenes]|uniref:Hydrogenase maturation protease n=1 Tax=Clostridium scatologenes TaxID=1548 RepID=A0A0E3GQL7_CLOSL|nr:hydrogenase maturation protease [Clostridium scatologenes]AKA68791.1 hydrogenase maturation protease [Clostridium scatologenes]